MLELPFKWSASFVVENQRVTVDVESDTHNRPEQRYVSFTGAMEGAGQVVMELAPKVADMEGAEDVRELCAAWEALHMVRFADMTPEQEAELSAVQTLLVLVNGERYGSAPDKLEDIEDADFSNTSDIIDSRDIMKRIETLASAFAAAGLDPEKLDPASPDYDAQGLEEDDSAHDVAAELKALRALESEAEDCGDWRYGATLVRGSYFREFAEQEAEEIGAIDRDAKWPLQFIDWDAAAEALKQDYSEVDYDGETYYVRD